jgi:DNA-binding transcriptional ArsR family regulator
VSLARRSSDLRAGVARKTSADLVDPTRRAILAGLERGGAGELARPFPTKLPALMKRLDVLDEAGLIRRTKSRWPGAVRAEPIREAVDWLCRYERFWPTSLDRLCEERRKLKRVPTTRRADDDKP